MWSGPPTVGWSPDGHGCPSAGHAEPRPKVRLPTWTLPPDGKERSVELTRTAWVGSTWLVPVQVRTNHMSSGTSTPAPTVPRSIVPWIPDCTTSWSAATLSADTAGMDRRVSAAVTTRARRMMARRIDDSLGRTSYARLGGDRQMRGHERRWHIWAVR